MFNSFQCQDIVNELGNQSYFLDQKIKEKKEKFQELCGHVEDIELFEVHKAFNSLGKFFGATKETFTTCSSDDGATPVLTSNGSWSVDEGKHC